VFDRYEADGGVRVWRVDLDGTHARPLTPNAPAQLDDVARDGSIVTFRQLDRERTVWVMPAGGGTARSLGEGMGNGQISRDGTRIQITRRVIGEGGLIRPVAAIVPAAGGNEIASFPIPTQANNLMWSPDGASFTFLDQSDPAWNLARIRMTGGTPERVTRFAEGRCTGFAWSPDGSRLAVARRIGDDAAVWVTAADGSKPVQAALFQGDEIFQLHWTKDGKQVVVNAGKRSSDAVLIRNFR
jgi:Tol biopolymer transport system component